MLSPLSYAVSPGSPFPSPVAPDLFFGSCASDPACSLAAFQIPCTAALAADRKIKGRRLLSEVSPCQVFLSSGFRRPYYSMISVTTPEPTVLPPSLMANLSPSSMAIGVISSIVIVMLSPGMHISVPSGSCRSPVTSVVLK